MRDDDIAAAIKAIYTVPTGGATWEQVMDRVHGLMGFVGSALYVLDRRTGGLIHGVWRNLDESSKQSYETEYAWIDPRRDLVFQNPDRRILYDYLHTPEAQIDRDPYYDWYQKEQKLRYYLGAQTLPGRPYAVGITMHRTRKMGHATPQEMALFDQLFAHMENAFELEYRLALAASAGQPATEVLNRQPTGIFLLDNHGRLLFQNRAAGEIVAAGDALAVSDGGLTALRAYDNGQLQKLLREALLLANGGVPAGGQMRLPRKSGRRDYVLKVSPIQAQPDLFQLRPAVCVLVSDPDRAVVLPARLLAELFGLTPAEIQLAGLLAQGHTVDMAAASAGISISTARSHLAAIFRKTETMRQSDLLRFLAALPPGD